MTDIARSLLNRAEKREEQFAGMMEKLTQAIRPGVVYSEPVTAGNYTVITASEIMTGGGFGGGFGFGVPVSSPGQTEGISRSQAETADSGGSGMGGGGGSNGRPVAIIVIGPDGVEVKPVVDITKIALAGVTVWGTMLMMLRRMRKAKKH